MQPAAAFRAHILVLARFVVMDTQKLAEAAELLLQACGSGGMSASLDDHPDVLMGTWPDGEKSSTEMSPEQAARENAGYKRLTATAVQNLRTYFDSCDITATGYLSHAEAKEMVGQMGLDDIKNRVALLLDSEVPDGQASFTEVCDAVSAMMDEHFQEDSLFTLSRDNVKCLHDLQMTRRKVGYAGTTWRPQSNTIWMLTNATIIVCGFITFAAVVYFRFILVPLTMAYFLTFLLGPLIDFMSQRPLVFMGKVYCKIVKLEPAAAKAAWEKRQIRGQPMPHLMDLAYPYDTSAVCCHARPPRELPGYMPDVAGAGRQALLTGKVPFPLALLGTLAFLGGFFYTLFYFVTKDIAAMLADEKFMDAIEDLMVDAKVFLETEHSILLTEFDPHLTRQQLTGNSTTPNEFTQEEFSAYLAPYISIINETVLTCLLCLYLLAGKNPKTEYDHHRVKHAQGKMAVMERIDLMNKNYVVLKTKLSILTAGLVTVILGVLQVKLWVSGFPPFSMPRVLCSCGTNMGQKICLAIVHCHIAALYVPITYLVCILR